MGTDTVERPHRKDDAVARYEKVVATTIEVAAAVFRLQVIGGETAVASRGSAVDYDQVDASNAVQT